MPDSKNPAERHIIEDAFNPLVAQVTLAGAKFLTGLQTRWIRCQPVGAQRIYFANHTSHLDFVLLCSALPALLRARTKPVAATDYWDRGMVRAYLIHRVFRAIVIDRKSPDKAASPLAALIEALDCGDSLILFPEGTRGNGEVLQPFKCGIYHLAKARPKLELVPVWIHNTHRVMPKGTALPIPLLCSVSFGTPLHFVFDEPKDVFLLRLQRAVLELSKQ